MYSSDILESNAPRRRRRYDPQFKADLVAHCQQRGISVASVAQNHSINANLLRRWIQKHERYGEPETNALPMPAKRDIAAQFMQYLLRTWISIQHSGQKRRSRLRSPLNALV